MLKCGSSEPNIQIKLILSQKYCMNETRVIGTFSGSGSLDPNIWVLLPFLDPTIRTLLWWKYIKDEVIMWRAWQTWLTQLGKFNLQLQSPSWNYDPNIRMRLNLKTMVQHHVYTPNFGVTYQGQNVFQVDPHFEVKWLIQYFWCHFQVQTQIFGSNMNLNPLIQSGPEWYTGVPKALGLTLLYTIDHDGSEFCNIIFNDFETSSTGATCKSSTSLIYCP